MISIHIAVNAIEYNISRSWKRSKQCFDDYFYTSDAWSGEWPNSVSWAEWYAISHTEQNV
jgi:hypothetical protein